MLNLSCTIISLNGKWSLADPSQEWKMILFVFNPSRIFKKKILNKIGNGIHKQPIEKVQHRADGCKLWDETLFSYLIKIYSRNKYRKRLFAGTVPANKNEFAGTILANKNEFDGTISENVKAPIYI